MIRTVPIGSVKPNAYNPNVMDIQKYTALKKMIERFGFLQPILVDQEGTIIDGEHRWKAMKELGKTEIYCVIYDGEESKEEYRKLLTISMNSVRGENDESKLKALFQELSSALSAEEMASLTGIHDSQIRLLLNYSDIPDVEVPAMEREDGTDGIRASQFAFGDISMVISDREMEAFEKAYDTYSKLNSGVAGFIGYLLDNVDSLEDKSVEATNA